MLAEERREQFKADVAQLKLKTGTSRNDTILMAVGGIAMLVGVVAAFLIYETSLSKNSALSIASEQVAAIAFLGVTVIGAALFLTGAIARVLRIWLLRQLYEGQAHVEQLTAAVRGR